MSIFIAIASVLIFLLAIAVLVATPTRHRGGGTALAGILFVLAIIGATFANAF
jgi:hypothetical protein